MTVTDEEQMTAVQYHEHRRAMGERITHHFALRTGGRMHFSRDNGLMYVQYTKTDERGQLILWVLPAVDSLLESVPVRARFERQRRSIVERGIKGAPIGHHGMLTLPPGEHVMTPGCLKTASTKLHGDDILYVNGYPEDDGMEQFGQFRESIFEDSPEQILSRLRYGFLIV